MEVGLHTPVTLPLRKEPQVPTEWETGWAPQPVSEFWRRQTLLSLLGIEPQIIQSKNLKSHSLPLYFLACFQRLGIQNIIKHSITVSCAAIIGRGGVSAIKFPSWVGSTGATTACWVGDCDNDVGADKGCDGLRDAGGTGDPRTGIRWR